jgi:hypothetical protein
MIINTGCSMEKNFKFFALSYLNDWVKYDEKFVTEFSAEDPNDRRQCMRRAAKYYGIARNFKTIPFDTERLKSALIAMDAVGSITEENVDLIVCSLAQTFQLAYGKNLVSAASKFLWLRHKSPVVILDSQAIQCLNKLSGGKLFQSDYAAYRKEWRSQFAKHGDCIKSACVEIVSIKEFSLAYKIADEDLLRLVRNRWFEERVFDKFLWWNSGS